MRKKPWQTHKNPWQKKDLLRIFFSRDLLFCAADGSPTRSTTIGAPTHSVSRTAYGRSGHIQLAPVGATQPIDLSRTSERFQELNSYAASPLLKGGQKTRGHIRLVVVGHLTAVGHVIAVSHVPAASGKAMVVFAAIHILAPIPNEEQSYVSVSPAILGTCTIR